MLTPLLRRRSINSGPRTFAPKRHSSSAQSFASAAPGSVAELGGGLLPPLQTAPVMICSRANGSSGGAYVRSPVPETGRRHSAWCSGSSRKRQAGPRAGPASSLCRPGASPRRARAHDVRRGARTRSAPRADEASLRARESSEKRRHAAGGSNTCARHAVPHAVCDDLPDEFDELVLFEPGQVAFQQPLVDVENGVPLPGRRTAANRHGQRKPVVADVSADHEGAAGKAGHVRGSDQVSRRRLDGKSNHFGRR